MHIIMRTLGISAIAIGLAGCAATHRLIHRHDNDYLKHASSEPALKVPANVSKKKIQSAYPVPKASTTETAPPSLVPPGSQINQIRQKMETKKTSSKAEMGRLVTLKSGNPALVLAMTEKAAWPAVGSALQKSGYQVLDQDNAMAAYFVLDPQESSGKLTSKTPILRVNLKAKGDNTIVTMATHTDKKLAKNVSKRVLSAVLTKIS
jgi:uncharacterized lipoprotein